MTKKTIVFDFDGVLADAKDEFLNALNFSLERLNLPQITLEEFNNKSKWGNRPAQTEQRVGHKL